MTTNQQNPWTTLSKEHIYQSPWISVEHHQVLNPAGNPGTYSVVHFSKLAIGIIPIDNDGYSWIVGQYRYPLEKYTWEIPEGGGNRDEEPIVAAKRELLEECGIIAEEYTLIQEMQLSNSATDEIAYLYLARKLSFTKAQPEENEQLTLRKIHFDELYKLVVNGEITDSLSVAAILKVKLMMLDGTLN